MCHNGKEWDLFEALNTRDATRIKQTFITARNVGRRQVTLETWDNVPLKIITNTPIPSLPARP